MRYRVCGLSSYGLNSLSKEDEHPPTLIEGIWHPLPYPFIHITKYFNQLSEQVSLFLAASSTQVISLTHVLWLTYCFHTMGPKSTWLCFIKFARLQHQLDVGQHYVWSGFYQVAALGSKWLSMTANLCMYINNPNSRRSWLKYIHLTVEFLLFWDNSLDLALKLVNLKLETIDTLLQTHKRSEFSRFTYCKTTISCTCHLYVDI